jgi:purine-binding chemotaxis protein CheW
MIVTETTSYLTCTLADEHYALPMTVVREVLRWRTPTIIPGAPAAIVGVLHHRGAVLPVIDPRSLLHLSVAKLTRDTRILSIECDGIQAGIVCDRVSDIITIDDGEAAAPTALPAARLEFVSGLIAFDGQPLALLDLQAIFAAVKAGHDDA